MAIVDSSLFKSFFGYKNKTNMDDYEPPEVNDVAFKPTDDLKQSMAIPLFGNGISCTELNDAILGMESKSLDHVNSDVTSALEEAKPMIKYPGYEPLVSPKRVTGQTSSHLFDSFQPLVATQSVSRSCIIPTSVSNAYYSFDVFVGNPNGHNYIKTLNKFMFNNKSVDVISNAIELFNTKKGMTQTGDSVCFDIFVGIKDPFLKFRFEGLRFYRQTGDIIINVSPVLDSFSYLERIRTVCKFFVTGEIFLDETENRIESMEISSLNFLNSNLDPSINTYTLIN